MKIEPLLRQLNLLNCILLAGIAAFALLVLVPLFAVEVRVPAPALSPKAAEEKGPETAEQAVNPPQQDYAIIAENNLFHPERKIPPEKKEENVPRPEFVLYGTLIVDNVKIAYLSDRKSPRTTPGRGKRQTALKIGETMSGYALREVYPDHIVMARGDDRIELKVISPESSKDKRGAEGVAPAVPGIGGRPVVRPPAVPQATPQIMPQVSPMQQPPVPGVLRSRRPMRR